MRNLFRDVSWQAVGTLFSSGIMLATNMITVRQLGREGFGAFGLVQTAGIWGLTLFSFGAPTCLMVLAGLAREKDKSHITGTCFLYLLLTGIGATIWICLDPPGKGSWLMPELAAGVGLLVILQTVTGTFFSLGDHTLRGADRFQLSNLLNVSNSIFMSIGIILGGYISGNYIGAIWGSLLSLFVLAFAVTVVAIRYWGFSLPSCKQFMAIGGAVSLRSYIVRISETITETFGILYLSSCHDLSGIAILVGCQRMSTILSKPASVMGAVLTGKVAGQARGAEDAKKTLQVARMTFAGGLLFAIPLLLFPSWFTVLTLGENFRDGVNVMILYILSSILRAHALITTGVLMGQGCQTPYVVVKISILIMTILGVLWMAPSYGAWGVAMVQMLISIWMLVVFSGILAYQSKSIQSIFSGDDLSIIRRLIRKF